MARRCAECLDAADPEGFTPQAPAVSGPQAASDLPALLGFAHLAFLDFARLARPVSDLLVRLVSVRQARLDSGRAQASTHLDRFNVRVACEYFPRSEARSAQGLWVADIGSSHSDFAALVTDRLGSLIDVLDASLLSSSAVASFWARHTIPTTLTIRVITMADILPHLSS